MVDEEFLFVYWKHSVSILMYRTGGVFILFFWIFSGDLLVSISKCNLCRGLNRRLGVISAFGITFNGTGT